ncbi:MAG: hypothetical protein K2J57_03400, partial [Bacteroidales bacterium]|nr:hypothetical protein [Bacteroidales bacterium]
MNATRTYLFAVVGGVLLSVGRMDASSLWTQVSLAISWIGFFIALQSVQEKNKTAAGVCIAVSLLSSAFWFIEADPSRQIAWIAAWLTGLLIVWPLRFIALGAIASAQLGYLFFWYTGIAAPLSDTLPLPFYIVTFLLLFAAAFQDNRTLYT